jgi:hypothetical protein
VEDDWRDRKRRIDDWKRRMEDCKARASRLTIGDAPEKHTAIQAELEGLMAEWEQIGPAGQA